MTIPTDEARPSGPAFPAVQANRGTSSTTGRPQNGQASPSFVARGIAVSALAVAIGALIGYSAKRDLLPGDARFVNFDAESTPPGVLTQGWSGFEAMPNGDTFAWCANARCGLQIQTERVKDRIVRIRLWPFHPPDSPPQTLTLVVNGTTLGTKSLEDVPSVISFDAGRAVWHKGANDLRFQFRYTAEPKSQYSDSEDPRRLAAGFDWLEVATPPSPPPKL